MLFILKPPSGGDTAISGELRDGKLPLVEAAVRAAHFERQNVLVATNQRRSLLARRNLSESGGSPLAIGGEDAVIF